MEPVKKRQRRCQGLPEEGLVRIYQIVGDPTANPPIPALIPVSRAAWWKGVKDGKYPKGIKLGPRTTCWDVKDVRALVSTSV